MNKYEESEFCKYFVLIDLDYPRNLLDTFSCNLGTDSEEQGEEFHQDLKVM